MADAPTKEQPVPAGSNDLAVRVADLEREVASLKRTLALFVKDANRKMLGTFGSVTDNDATREAERLGREWRERQPKC
jgi:hypothetical protein